MEKRRSGEKEKWMEGTGGLLNGFDKCLPVLPSRLSLRSIEDQTRPLTSPDKVDLFSTSSPAC